MVAPSERAFSVYLEPSDQTCRTMAIRDFQLGVQAKVARLSSVRATDGTTFTEMCSGRVRNRRH